LQGSEEGATIEVVSQNALKGLDGIYFHARILAEQWH
jgi:hypothetical protein